MNIIPLLIITIVVLIIILLVAEFYLFRIVNKLRPYKSNNPDLKQAHAYATWGASITLIIIVLVVVLGLLAFLFLGPEVILLSSINSGLTNFIIYAFLFFVVFMNFLTGILAAMAATNITKSGSKNTDVNIESAYTAAVIAATISLATPIIIIFIIIALFLYQKKMKERYKESVLLLMQKKAIENKKNKDILMIENKSINTDLS